MTENKKTFKYKDYEFHTQQNVLKIQNIASPILQKLTMLSSQYTSDVDMKAVNEYRVKLKNLENKDLADKEYLTRLQNEGDPKKDIPRVEKIILRNADEKEKLIKKYNEDEQAQRNADLFQAMEALAVKEVITDENIIFPFLEKYLIGDVTKLDKNDPDILSFIEEVFADFFLSMIRRGKR